MIDQNKETVYGPYLRKDGRKHVVVYNHETQKRTTISYPKHLMQVHLGRELEEWETVDHKDNDYTNDSLDNLQLLTLAENIKKSAKGSEMWWIICPVCKETVLKFAKYIRRSKKRKMGGPYCSKSCAGKMHH